MDEFGVLATAMWWGWGATSGVRGGIQGPIPVSGADGKIQLTNHYLRAVIIESTLRPIIYVFLGLP